MEQKQTALNAPSGPGKEGSPSAGEVCPNCGGALVSRQCKVFCARCGLLVYNCSEF